MNKILIALVTLSSSVLMADADVEKGKQLFATNCATCHGPDGTSQTEVGKSVKARNLVAEPFKKGEKEADVLTTINKGIEGTGMASFGHLPEGDRKALAKFVVSLRPAAGKKTADAKPADAKKK
jgi:mono/diheme cytochrome c family protein